MIEAQLTMNACISRPSLSVDGPPKFVGFAKGFFSKLSDILEILSVYGSSLCYSFLLCSLELQSQESIGSSYFFLPLCLDWDYHELHFGMCTVLDLGNLPVDLGDPFLDDAVNLC